MKRFIFLCVSIFFFGVRCFSQCAIDTAITHNVPGIYPDSVTGLPHAVVGDPYSTVIQMKVIHDTTVIVLGTPQPATIDSVDITNVTGLPTGFTYSCNPTSCHFPGGSDACITLQGPAPVSGMVGVYPITVFITTYGKVLGFSTPPQSSTVNRYSIVIDQNVGMQTNTSLKFDAFQNTPNPFGKSTEISFSSPGNERVELKVINLLGKVVFLKSVLAQRGLNKMMLSSKDFENGIYIYTLSNSKNSITRRMIVSNE
ncbi:MAG: T9SS type A sorting domain-containing protein [Bacteroidetes bacterium]|nr:T9SS type A sorting domain-containing protein [Bacteroidota bacterium]